MRKALGEFLEGVVQMKIANVFTGINAVIQNRSLCKNFCALMLAVCIFCTAVPSAVCEMYSESYLSLYYADATMKEGKTSGYKERFFANIAAISIMDLQDQNFLTQYTEAVRNGYNYRVFVMHEKGMPDTDLAILYCFEDSSWLMKNTTSAAKSVYIDVSWEMMQGIDFKQKQKNIITKQAMPGCDESFECNAEYVCQIFMEFILFLEERDKALEALIAGTVDEIPELPREIESWPLDLPISVQLPKDLTVLDALFTVEHADLAAMYYRDIPEDQKYAATVDTNNVASGTIRFWEAGPHLIGLVLTVSINGQKQSICHNISIDTSHVEVLETDEDANDKMNNRVEEITEGLLRAYEQDTSYNTKEYNQNADKPEFSKDFSSLVYGDSTVGIAACGLFALMNIEHYDHGETYSVEEVKQIISKMPKMTNEAGGGLNGVHPYTEKINYYVPEDKSWIYVDNKDQKKRREHVESMQEWLEESGQYAVISTTNQNIRNSKNNGPHFIAVLAYDKENDRFLIADSAAMYLNQTYSYDRINAKDGSVTGYAWVKTEQMMGWTDLAVNLVEKTEQD